MRKEIERDSWQKERYNERREGLPGSSHNIHQWRTLLQLIMELYHHYLSTFSSNIFRKLICLYGTTDFTVKRHPASFVLVSLFLELKRFFGEKKIIHLDFPLRQKKGMFSELLTQQTNVQSEHRFPWNTREIIKFRIETGLSFNVFV